MADPHSILKKVFGYDSFRPGQEDIVRRLLDGQDVLAVMPTGAGKSICYQVPALLLPGITIVVSPLVSLMKDQVGALVQAGVAAAFLNNSLTDNQKALMLHRIGDMARLQTDAIIISSCLGVVWVGLIGTYKMIVNSVSGYVNLIFNSVISSFGNLIATESREKQFQLFLVYRFFAIWVYGFSAVGFFLLLSPLVELYVGADRVLATSIIAWYLTDYFFKGERVVLSNFKTAAGVFEQDKYLSILQGIVNLVVSIALVFKIGLAGVFIGTVVSGLIANITKPIIIYRVCFEKSAVSYFQESIKYLLVIGAALAVLIPLQNLLMPQVTIAKFALMIVIITVVFNGIFLIVFGRTEEFKYLYGMVKGRRKRS